MPSNLLIDGQEDLIEIKLFYRVKKNNAGVRQFVVLDEEKGKKAIEDGDDSVDCLVTKWSPQTWQMNNNLLKQSMTYNKISGNNEVDFSRYQDNVFRYCLKEWDVTDKDGSPIPPTPENVGQLPAAVAQALIRLYDSTITVDQEEKKE
mgnify:CR=1 FL=1|tara:strand:- start:20471 stop:20914 length:444 start_codon:yes stop_codon:yes gene_type:complete